MYPVVCHLCGPFSIHSYGLCIAAGVALALILGLHDKRVSAVLSREHLFSLLNLSIVSGVFGGRLFHVLTEPEQYRTVMDIFAFWEGGFAVLGTLIAIIVSVGLYLWKRHLLVWRILDLAGIYAPLIQGFGRIGCFCAGCCYGVECSSWWAITYTHPLSLAPLGIPLCPVQLLNAAALIGLFLLCYFLPLSRVPGVTGLSAFAGLLLIRFMGDFWRGDASGIAGFGDFMFSVHQLVSFALLACVLVAILFLVWRDRRHRSHESV